MLSVKLEISYVPPIQYIALNIFRTPLTLYIGIDSIKAVTKDGKVVLLSYEEQELKDFLLCQVSTRIFSLNLLKFYFEYLNALCVLYSEIIC